MDFEYLQLSGLISKHLHDQQDLHNLGNKARDVRLLYGGISSWQNGIRTIFFERGIGIL